MQCSLCNTTAKSFHDQFHECTECGGIFRSKDFFLTFEEEKTRYLCHNNNAEDLDYQNFVAPITKEIIKTFNTSHTGLDFGAGTGSAVYKVLTDQKYKIIQYDPFFHNYPELLKNNYDYVACCEVVEHFHNPNKEFRLLKNLLKPKGILYCQTALYNNEIDFAKWYYKNDPTHVFIYREKTFEWIKQNYNFKSLNIKNKLITLQKGE